MAFTALTPTEVSANKPISTTLMDKIRTNFDDHEARLLASGSSGAIGEVLNGSFETAQGGNPNWPDKWAVAQYSGGQVILDTASTAHGKKSLKMLHTVSGGGGGYAESDYVAVSSLYMPPLSFAYYASVANMQIEVWARYYSADANGDPSTFLGERCIYRNTATNPIVWSAVQVNTIPMAYNNSRYVKYRFIGGVSGSTQTGTAWFDAVGVLIRRVYYDYGAFLNIPETQDQNAGWHNIQSALSITIPAGGWRWLVLQIDLMDSYIIDDNNQYYGGAANTRFLLNGGPAGRYSTTATKQDLTYIYDAKTYKTFDMVYDLAGVTPGTYTLQLQGAFTPGLQYCKYRSQGRTHNARSGFISANGTTLAITDSYDGAPLW